MKEGDFQTKRFSTWNQLIPFTVLGFSAEAETESTMNVVAEATAIMIILLMYLVWFIFYDLLNRQKVCALKRQGNANFIVVDFFKRK